MTDDAWPFGTGGECGPQFAAVWTKMRGDIRDQGGIRAAVEYWRETGFLGEWAQVDGAGVLTEADMQRMERAMRYSDDAIDDGERKDG